MFFKKKFDDNSRVVFLFPFEFNNGPYLSWLPHENNNLCTIKTFIHSGQCLLLRYYTVIIF